MRVNRAALHRLIAVDTRIQVAVAELTVGAAVDPRALDLLGISDLGEIIAKLESHLVTIRTRMRAMFAEAYPRQPGTGG